MAGLWLYVALSAAFRVEMGMLVLKNSSNTTWKTASSWSKLRLKKFLRLVTSLSVHSNTAQNQTQPWHVSCSLSFSLSKNIKVLCMCVQKHSVPPYVGLARSAFSSKGLVKLVMICALKITCTREEQLLCSLSFLKARRVENIVFQWKTCSFQQ